MQIQGAACHFWLLTCKRLADMSEYIHWKTSGACEGGQKRQRPARRTGERGEQQGSSSGERIRLLLKLTEHPSSSVKNSQ